MQSAWTVGTALEAALAWIVLSTLGWRWLLVFSSVPLFVLVFGYPWLPESPYWLVAKNKFEEAEHLVTKIAKYNKIESPFEVNFKPHQASDHEHNYVSIQGTDDANSINSRNSFVMEAKTAGARMKIAIMGTLRKVFSKRLALTTSLLWLIWYANATTYYGLVLLTTSLQTSDGKDGKPRCTEEGEAAFTSSSYTAIFITALAEAPGLLVAALLIDSKGRVWCLRAGMALCSVAIFSLLFQGGKVLQLILLFVSRAAIEGTFSVLYVYTPELYPTAIRSFGLALCNGFSRLGGFTAPFATVYLVESGETMWSVIALGMLCLLAAVATFLLPIETMGLDLQIPDTSETYESEQYGQEEAPLMISNGERSGQLHVTNET
jgi:MFS family permease